MSLASFADLKASIAKWIKRADLAAQIPDFVTLAEARFARDLRLRAQLVSGQDVTTPGVGAVSLPTGWLEFESLSVDGYGRLDPASPDAVSPQREAGRPRWYAVDAGAVRLWPEPDGAYTVRWTFYRRFALTDDASSNWLLVNHPGVYLWASLAEAAPFVVDDQRAMLWETKYRAEIEALRVADDRARFGGTPLRIVNG